MGQTSTQTTTQTTPGASGNEASLLGLLTRLAQQSGGQLGDLSQLARGNVGGPSESDIALAQGTIGRTGEMAQRELQRIAGPLLAQLQESGQGRGGSLQSLDRILAGREITGRLADILGGAQQQQGQALMNLPFQRAETQLGANQLLFNMLTGAANPVLANQLQSRLANVTSTTKTKQPYGPMDWAKLGVGVIGAIPTGGASLALPALSGGVRRGELSGQSGGPNLDYLGMYGLGGR